MEEVRRILVVGDDIAVHDAYGRTGEQPAGGKRFLSPVKSAFEERDPLEIRFKLCFCADAENGVDLVGRSLEENRPFSVAFIHMKQAGIEIARRIRKKDPDVKVVVLRESSGKELIGLCEKESLFFQRKDAGKDEIIQFAELLAKLWRLEREKNGNHGTSDPTNGMNPDLEDERIERVSHQLRTPVASIMGFCDTILADRNMPEEVRMEFLGIMRLESIRLNQFIDKLRDKLWKE